MRAIGLVLPLRTAVRTSAAGPRACFARRGAMNLPEIRSRVRQLIRNQQLGCDVPRRVGASTDGGSPCSACGQSIPKGAVVYEAILGKQTLRFHLVCYAVWKEECSQ